MSSHTLINIRTISFAPAAQLIAEESHSPGRIYGLNQVAYSLVVSQSHDL